MAIGIVGDAGVRYVSHVFCLEDMLQRLISVVS
jgi:hypothetical protein